MRHSKYFSYASLTPSHRAAGGYIGDAIDIRAPFDAAFVSFLIAGTFARLALPYIPPSTNKDKPGQNGISGFLAPLKIMVPQRIRHASGKIGKHYGVILLCAGIFTGVVSEIKDLKTKRPRVKTTNTICSSPPIMLPSLSRCTPPLHSTLTKPTTASSCPSLPFPEAYSSCSCFPASSAGAAAS